eukprot:7418824-Pyramimonas_sp.AAC.1
MRARFAGGAPPRSPSPCAGPQPRSRRRLIGGQQRARSSRFSVFVADARQFSKRARASRCMGFVGLWANRGLMAHVRAIGTGPQGGVDVDIRCLCRMGRRRLVRRSQCAGWSRACSRVVAAEAQWIGAAQGRCRR